MKWCSKCKKVKERMAFSKDRCNKDGLQANCKQCQHNYRHGNPKVREATRVRMRKWRSRNLDKVHAIERRMRVKRVYGITQADYLKMAEAQNQRCAICKCLGKLVIDHDHATDKVRGLLCFACNSGLGHFRENPKIMRAAMAYLDKFAPVIDKQLKLKSIDHGAEMLLMSDLAKL